MNAKITFKAVIEDGIIQVPERFLGLLLEGSRVDVSVNMPESHSGRVRKVFTANDFVALRLDTSSWKFSRDEANER